MSERTKIQKLNKILVLGANGQLGEEQKPCLQANQGKSNVLTTDIFAPNNLTEGEKFKTLDITDKKALGQVVSDFKPDLILNFASILSAAGEKNPQQLYKVNINGFKNAIDIATENKIRIFSASTIATFGPQTPKVNTPNITIQRPTTIYGCSKVFNELLGIQQNKKQGLDFRCLRIPVVISKTMPKHGSAIQTVEIFQKAAQTKKQTSQVNEETTVSTIFSEDLNEAIFKLCEASNENLKSRVQNVESCSMNLKETIEQIRQYVPEFNVNYEIDYRQKIVESWPKGIDVSEAEKDWKFERKYNLLRIVKEMMEFTMKEIQLKIILNLVSNLRYKLIAFVIQ